MAFYDPVTWVPYLPWLPIAYLVWDAWAATMEQNRYIIGPSMVIGTVYLMAKNWTILKLGRTVPGPYLVCPSPCHVFRWLMMRYRMKSFIYLKHKPIAKAIFTYGILNSPLRLVYTPSRPSTPISPGSATAMSIRYVSSTISLFFSLWFMQAHAMLLLPS